LVAQLQAKGSIGLQQRRDDTGIVFDVHTQMVASRAHNYFGGPSWIGDTIGVHRNPALIVMLMPSYEQVDTFRGK
jgi:hypothetical protein